MQVYLESQQRLRLNALARSLGRPAAELIREAVSRYLDEQNRDVPGDDALFSLVGAAGELETATDIASNHHRYLALADASHPRYAPKRPASPSAKARKKRGRAR